jgi:uncharacterized protein with GYD domain
MQRLDEHCSTSTRPAPPRSQVAGQCFVCLLAWDARQASAAPGRPWAKPQLAKENPMPKYLCQGSYTREGLQGLLKEGGSRRRAVVEHLAKELGGKLEAFYFAFGADDFHIILDLPSNVDMTAVALVANASGTVKSRITVLLTPEEVDQATKKQVEFRPPAC